MCRSDNKGQMYLSDSQSGGGELGEQTAEDGGMEIHQQTSLSAETHTHTGRQLIINCPDKTIRFRSRAAPVYQFYGETTPPSLV